ncbi:AtpZ/AtpI family protein [Paracoccus sp. S-4012]|uniref:AtpZ/AtpI family protein n=1 Tax=Paracoccus sp. S-4012 TaxID=2665648 RepID=UPI00351B390F
MPGRLEDEEQRRRDAARLADLEARLGQRKAPAPVPSGLSGDSFNQANLAWRMVIELVAGMVIGFIIGWGLDWLFGTRPFMLVIFLMLGFVAGVKTMLRTAREITAPPPDAGDKAARDAPEDDEDEDR